MRAAVYLGNGHIAVQSIETPAIGSGEILVRVETCGVCHTDLKKIEYDLLSPPRIYGHETAGIIAANMISRRMLDRMSYDAIVVAGVGCFVAGGIAFALCESSHVKGIIAIVLPMFLVSLSNGSSLSLAVSGAIASEHGRAATASGLVGFFQIGSASLAATVSSGLLGTGSHVLATAIPFFAIVAAVAIVPRWYAARRTLSMRKTPPR